MNELRCVIGGSELNYPYPIEDFLNLEGHLIVAKHQNARTLLQSVINIRPDLIIIHTNIETDNLLELCKNISEQKIAPILLIGSRLELNLLSVYYKTDVFLVLIPPITRENFLTAVEAAVQKNQMILSLEKKAQELEKQIEHRVLIEKAKGMLMKSKGMSEDEAYNMLRKISMDQCIPMQRVAKAIIKKLG